MDSYNKKWDQKRFEKIRKDVLASWPTGKDVDTDEAIEYHKQLPQEKILSRKLAEGQKRGIPLAQPRGGVARLDEHIHLLQFLERDGGADLLPTTVDSYTRQNRYKDAERGLNESLKAKRSMLNGLPVVNYGVKNCRLIIESVSLPVEVRHGTPDARLLAEITLAAGFTSFEGGAITYNVPYSKNVPIEKSIIDYQYVDRLVGYYEEQGVTINRESYGALTGPLVPPSICHAISIIEGLLAAEQGVKNITLGYGQCGNIFQDIAGIKTLSDLGEEYLEEFGYKNVTLTTAFHQWMGAFPQDEIRAFGVICLGAAVAALGGATKVITKSTQEAFGIPTKEANAAGLRATKQVLSMLRNQKLTNVENVRMESEMIELETRAIMDKVIEFGDGDAAIGTVRAFRSGAIDVPFAPSEYNRGKVMTVRDHEGAVRFLYSGNLPFSEEILDFHKHRIMQRTKAEGRKPGFQMVLDDIYSVCEA